MPMSPRLLRPIASRITLPDDADALAYVLAVNAADGRPLEKPVVEAIDAFVIGCKSDGIWSAIKASCILMGARTLSGALTPLVGTAPTNNNFVSGDYNRKTGLVGDGVGKYLDTNRSNNADPQNSKHIAVYLSVVASTFSTGRAFIGAAGTANGRSAIGASANSSNCFAVVNTQTSNLAGTITAGFFGASRSVSFEFTHRLGGADTTDAAPSATPADKEIYVFARENDSGGAEAFVPDRIAFYSIGEDLSLASLDTRLSALYTAIGAAIP